MMQESAAVFADLKRLLAFAAEDAARLAELQPILAPHIPAITERFYLTLLAEPSLAALAESRLESLKATHRAWFADLLNGCYEREFFDRQLRIGLAHVRIGLKPHWVEGMMSFVRVEAAAVIAREVGDRERAVALTASLTRVLDLVLAIVNLSYHEARMKRLSDVTGMTRALLENLILQG